MLQAIRKSFAAKVIALVIIPGLMLPSIPTAKANGGPSDVNFKGGSGGEFVDLSSGSFNYAIPLIDVGGYPITLSYDAGVTMNQQASMVGLGWNLNMGAINRHVRGLPDDFAGDPITTTMNLRPNLTIENTFAANSELIGWDVGGGSGGLDGTLQLGFIFNNYTGNENLIGGSASASLSAGQGSGPGAFLSGGLSSSSRSGLNSNLGISLAMGQKGQYTTSLGLNRNSLYGSSSSVSFGFPIPLVGLAGTYPLGMQSYTPTATFEFENKSWSLDLGAGGLVFAGIDLHGSGSRTKTTVCLTENERTQKAYGYMNQEQGYDKNALQDFNLSLPQVHENVAGLPTPMPTNDYFVVANSGSMFRPVRNDAGYVKDPTTRSTGNANSVAGDAALGVGFEAGINLAFNWNNTTSGNWEEGNPFSNPGSFEFTHDTPMADPATKAHYEKFTLKKINSQSTVSDSRYTGIKKNTALRQEIDKDNGEIVAFDYMVDDNAGSNFLPGLKQYYQHERRDRNEVMEPQSNLELRFLGEDSFKNYSLNDFSFSSGSYTAVSNKARSNVEYPNNHIGKLTVIGTGGTRDVFGLPVMNQSNQVSFNMSHYNNYPSPTASVDGQGLIAYAPGQDNSLNNKRGDNHLYLKNRVPAHATSYLLTEQLSDNYSDRTGNGPTPDDYGTYAKFNYAYNGIKKWRFPYAKNKASYNEGFKSNELDDLATYAYGERDEWYVHSIESKDYIAEFHYFGRNDAFGVQDENGGPGSGPEAKQLHQIKLYTRKGREFGESPVKTVHFIYDYSLCQNVPDNPAGGVIDDNEIADQGGKLTLKELYFTGHDSPHGKLNKYKFTYAANANYDLGKTDRWGNYQNANPVSYLVGSTLDNAEYPYTVQNKAQADANARKWKLSAIDLPIGSRIEIDYEANDYEYIQNYEATRMYKIGGFYSTDIDPWDYTPESGDFGSNLFDPDNDDLDNFYIRVDLGSALAGTESEALLQFQNHILPQKINSTQRYLYYNTLLDLAPHNDGIFDPSVYEYIQGYAEIIENGWYLLETSPGSGLWDKVVFRVKPELLNETKFSSPITHPISRKAWQVIKEALPLVLYPEDDLQAIYAKDGSINCGDSELLDGGTKPNLGDDSKNHKKNLKSIRSVYHMMRKTGFASRAELPKCWVRMRTGLSSKIGGGYRVKEMRTYDNWEDFATGESSAVYGTQYEYTTTNSRGETISSGVASYEPIQRGADEIALRHPHFYVHAQKGTPSEKFYSEFPLNEEIFASSQVRYSKVRVSSIAYPGLELSTPGSTVFEHYTAKDYPIIQDYTNPKTELRKPGALNLIGIKKRRFGVTYGAAVVTNDMHGRLKSKRVFSAPTADNPGGNEVHSLEFLYHQNPDGTLSSEIPTIGPDGSYKKRLAGMSMDMLTHLNKKEANSSTVAIKTNLEYTPPYFFVPSVWPSGNTSETSIYSSLSTKVIHQSGLLQKVMVEDNGRSKTTEHLLYDAKTGNPLATEIIPEKGDGKEMLYEYVYPAYWAYDGMGLTSDNSGLKRFNITGGGTTVLPAEKPYFYPGDELTIIEFSTGIIPIPLGALANHWVVENETTGAYFLADADGVVFNPDPSKEYLFKVQHPGKSNDGKVAMASVVTLKKHTGLSPYVAGYTHANVVNLSGLEYFEEAKLRTDPCAAAGSVINPYSHNLKGLWRVQHGYQFDGDRDYSSGNSRKDGLLTAYRPFWQNVGGNWLPIYDPGRPDYSASDPYQEWIKTSSATLFDSYGFNLETKNALDLYQSQGTGYNKQLQKNVSTNSRYAESGYDGFEDYFLDGVYDHTGAMPFLPYGCHVRHFGYLNGYNFVKMDEAHTGRYSLFVLGDKQGHFASRTWDGSEPSVAPHGAPYVVQPAEVIPTFRLMNDQAVNKYVLTVWVKERGPSPASLFDYVGAKVELDIPSWTVPVEEKRSNIIDGWQRIELTFTVDPAIPNNSFVDIHLVALNPHGVYFDDLRIQPFDSEMQSVAVDPIFLRNMATLDSRDFFTSYQYDENGTLVRIIRETERGKQTIQESRSGKKISN